MDWTRSASGKEIYLFVFYITNQKTRTKGLQKSPEKFQKSQNNLNQYQKFRKLLNCQKISKSTKPQKDKKSLKI